VNGASLSSNVNQDCDLLDPFSYLSFLTSVVLALGVTRLLTGIGKLLQHRGRLNLYSIHLLWALNLFLFLVLDWWILYRWHTQQSWTFFLFVFVLLTPIVAFLLAVLLFPEPIEAGIDLKQHFYANQRWFFTLGALLPPLDAIDTLLKGWDHFVAQGVIYPVTLIVLFGLMVTAARTRQERFQAFFAIFFLAYILVFIAINLSLLT
jgi:hypothetical protein